MPRKKRNDVSSYTRDIATSWARERPDLDAVDYLLPIYLVRIGRIVERTEDRRWKEQFGLSGAEVRALLALRRAGGECARRPTDLFRALLVASGTITKQVDRLVSAGVVARRPDPSNAGGFLVQLTEEGKAIADRAMDSLCERSLLSRSSLSLDDAERGQLLRYCERILLDLEANPSVVLAE